jgi:hypothetical protein
MFMVFETDGRHGLLRLVNLDDFRAFTGKG